MNNKITNAHIATYVPIYPKPLGALGRLVPKYNELEVISFT